MPLQKDAASSSNDAGTSRQIDANLTRPCSPPVRFEIVGIHGNIFGDFESAKAAAEFAAKRWPGQTQDEDRTGRGWDIQIVGADR